MQLESRYVQRGYKRKTISRVIRQKVNSWLASIDDEALRERAKASYIVTGGCIASMLIGKRPNDIDIYMSDPLVARDVAEHYCHRLLGNKVMGDNQCVPLWDVLIEEGTGRVKVMIKSIGVVEAMGDSVEGQTSVDGYEYFEMLGPSALDEYIDRLVKYRESKGIKEDEKEKQDRAKGRYRPVTISTNAITLSDDVQLIMRFTGPPEEIHKNYDFVHCTNWFTEEEGLVLRSEAMESLMAMELRYVGSLYPLCSMFRIKKFIQRGFTISAGEMLKIAYDIASFDLDDVDVLKDQLVGVDAAYFVEVIDILRKTKEDGKGLDRTYLFETVNRVFDAESFDEAISWNTDGKEWDGP